MLHSPFFMELENMTVYNAYIKGLEDAQKVCCVEDSVKIGVLIANFYKKVETKAILAKIEAFKRELENMV